MPWVPTEESKDVVERIGGYDKLLQVRVCMFLKMTNWFYFTLKLYITCIIIKN